MLDFNSLHSEIEKHTSELDKLMEEFHDRMKGKFTELTQAFFAECPRVQAVVWNQYTPYFNDGEECTFSVHEAYFITRNFDPENLLDAYSYEDDDEYGTICVNCDWSDVERYERYAKECSTMQNYYTERAKELREQLENDDGTASKCAKLSSFLQSQEDVLRSIFGDHVTVYLTPTETMTEDYNHD